VVAIRELKRKCRDKQYRGENSVPEELESQLTEHERKRIREEMRYALAVLTEGSHPPQPASSVEKLLSYLSNGFVLLLVGSLITSILVPRFQQRYEKKTQKTALMQECLAQFLLYGNSTWQEFYTILPLVHNTEIDTETYDKYIGEISQIKLRRYDAFAKVEALAITFRTDEHESPVEKALYEYAVRVNSNSTAINNWLRNLYCAPDKCVAYGGAPVDPQFRSYEAYLRLEPLLQKTQEDAKSVSELMVGKIRTVE
jgi:hypothetical protein